VNCVRSGTFAVGGNDRVSDPSRQPSTLTLSIVGQQVYRSVHLRIQSTMDAAKTPDAASGANDLTKNNPMAVDSYSRGNPTARTQDSTSAETKEASEPVKEALTLSTTKTTTMAIETKAPASATTATTEKSVASSGLKGTASAMAGQNPGQKVAPKANATVVPASCGTQNTVNSGNDRVTVDKIHHQPLVPSAPSAPAMATPVAKMVQNISKKPPSESTTPASKAMTPPPSSASARATQTTVTMNDTGTVVAVAVAVAKAPSQTPTANKPNVAVTPKIPATGRDPSQPQPTRTPSGTTDASRSDHPSTPAAAAPTEHGHDNDHEPAVMDEETLLEEATRKIRAPLVDPYAPYIIPSDTTLADARQRLRTALNQTRKLRAAFTERVYGKYRVCLQPTPTTDQILKTILADPGGTCATLEIEIKELKEEKDIEKKEAQKLNAELMAANNSSNTNAGDATNTAASSMNADNAEQLMYITAGLSLVILPEKDVSGVDMSTYPDRAPINPETGQRVRSISSAAAAAGEVMLDRARKAAAMREERKRRRQLQLLAGEDQESSESNNYSRLSVLSSTTMVPLHVIPVATTTVHVNVKQAPAAPRVAPIAPAVTVAPVPKAAAAAIPKPLLAPLMPTILPVKTLSSKRQSVTKAAASTTSPASTAASAKQLRARMQASMTSQTLLSLQPSADELRTDGKHSAATIAMIDRGVGQHGANNKINQQQRYSHPFPESVGGRRRAMNPGGTKKEVAPAAHNHPFSHPAYPSLALPPIPTAKERRTRKRMPVLDNSKACSSRARLAIHSVLDQFFSNKNANPMDISADVNASEDSPTRPTKRRITEISFMLGMQKFGESNERVPDSGDTSSNPFSSQGVPTSSMEPKSIDPVFAFNVLQAVGLVNAIDRDDGVESRNFQSQIDASLFRAFEQSADSEEGAQSRRSVAKLKSLWKKFSTRKRTFTETFFEGSSEEQCVSIEQRQSPRVNKDKPSGNEDRIKQKHASTMETGPAEAEETPLDKMITERVDEEKTIENDVVPSQAPEAKQAPPVVAIRGGGEVLLDSSEGSNKGNKAQNAGQPPINGSERKPTEAPGDARRDQSSGQDRQQQRNSRAANTRMQDMPGQAQSTGQMRAPDMSGHRMGWDDPSRQSLVLLNPRLSGNDTGYSLAPGSHQTPLIQHGGGGASGARMQGQLPDHYHHHSTANALQLAHHLRHATASIARMPPHGHQPAGDLADYIGSLHHSQAQGGYDWSSLGAASVAAVASAHSSLAALGLNPHRGMVNFSVQDRARALLAREQQTAAAAHAAAAHRQNMSSQQAVAFLGGAGNHGYAPSASPHFPHLAGHSSASAALLNSSAALMGHSGMQQVSTAPPVPSSAPRMQQAKADQRSSQAGKKEQSKKEQRSKKEQAPRKDQASKKDQPSEKELPPKIDEGPLVGFDEKMNIEDSSAADSSNSKKRKLSDSENGAVKPGKRLAVTAEPTGSRKDSKSENKVAATKVNDNTGKSNPTTLSTPKETMLPVSKTEENKTTVSLMSDAKEPPKVQKPEAAAVSASKSESGSVQAMKVIIPKGLAPVVDVNMDDSVAAVQPSTGGMQFFVPPAPPSIGSEVAGLVLSANCHEAVDIVESNGTPAHGAALIEHLISVGTAVPIPKALVANPLKDRLSTGGVGAKNATNNGMHALTRDVVVATVLIWLWKYHEECFQRAFAKSGRIDVDPECKWIIHAAVDTSVRSLNLEATDPAVRGTSPLAAALAAHRSKGHAGQKGGEVERSQSSTKLDMLTASIVSKALMAGSSVDEQMVSSLILKGYSFVQEITHQLALHKSQDSIIPHFHDLVQYLDECRKCALHSKSQERALLAALISRKATMSLPFSHAYVSSMVRAGEALGHGELFEVVQNEEVLVSTMIPYDVFTDESGAWEDPCRPPEGYTSGLTGDDLMRRAHARAMIQKSLKKLQDRHNIKGGTPTTGPYTDPPNSQSGFGNISDSSSKSVSPNASTPRGWLKRQRTSFSEPPVQPGTGSATATSWSLYDPRHYSAPLIWKADDVENSPYGRHSKSTRPRSLSLSQVGIKQSASRSTKGKLGGRSMSVASYDTDELEKDSSGDLRSTREIAWTEIAGIFQPVNLPGESKAQKEKEETACTPETRQIFAPFVRTVESFPVASEEESDEEEDLSDNAVLARHQIVLDGMKEKLSAILESRKKQQDRKKTKK
jgi:hypothetical protein